MSPHALPTRFVPQLALLTKAVPDGDGWFHEIKYDGYRIGCRLDRGDVTLLSRNNRDWTATFPEVCAAARRLPARAAFLDGEVAVLLPDGRTGFQALQNAISSSTRENLVYYVFDLLFLDGEDLSGLPLETRKARLQELVAGAPPSLIRYSAHMVGSGSALFSHACRLRLEGLVSKRRDLPYHPGRHDGWLKTKCVARQEFVVGGFTDPEGARQGIGALLIGYYDDDGRLVFAGRVGTGFTNTLSLELRTRLERITQKTPPFQANLERGLLGHAHWTRPELVAETTFTEWTNDGKIRHPSFQGLRSDKRPRDIRRERPQNTPKAGPRSAEAAEDGKGTIRRSRRKPEGDDPQKAPKPGAGSAEAAADGKGTVRRSRRRPEGDDPQKAPKTRTADTIVAGVRISHPGRVMYPQAGLTKLDVARYYEAAAPWMLPHIAGRPLTLVRCGEGLRTGDMRRDCMYLKHSKVWAPPALRRVQIRERTKVGEYVIADTAEALMTLVQMDVLEIHTWNSTAARVEEPDRLVFDIDPGPDVAWPQVIETARLVRDMLQALDLESFVKTTGGKGLHVVVPLTPKLPWDVCLEFSRQVASAIVRSDPSRYTTSFPKAGRERKLLIDYMRNNRTNTSVAAFSTRARPDATVSLPIAWNDVTPRLDPAAFTADTLHAALARRRKDPWADYWTTKQAITARARKAVAGL